MPLLPRNPYDPNAYGSFSGSSTIRIVIGVICATLVVLFVLLVIWRRKKLPLPTHDIRLNYHLPNHPARRRPAVKKQVLTIEAIDENFPKRKLELSQLEITGEDAKQLRTDLKQEMERDLEAGDAAESPTSELKRVPSSTRSFHSYSTQDPEGKSMFEIDLGPDTHFRLTCPICLDEFTQESEVRVLSCRHTFHAACLDPWLTNRSHRCPSCRKPAIEIQENPAAREGTAEQSTTAPQPEPIQAPIVAPQAPEPVAQRGRFLRFGRRRDA